MNRQKKISKWITVLVAMVITVANIASYATPVSAQSAGVPVLIGPTDIQDTNQPVYEWTNTPNPEITSYELIMFNNGEPYSKTIYTLDQLIIDGEKITLDKGETFGVGNFSWAVRYILKDGTISEWSAPFVFNILPDVAAQEPGSATATQPAEESTPTATLPVEEATATPESNGADRKSVV